jgi:hypothetical protein
MNFYSPRATVFGRNAVKLEARPGEALDIDFIRAHCPALFAEVPHSSRSERFAHIPTHQMIDALSKEGWAVTGVRVGGSSDAEKRAFTKHMLRLRRKDQLQPRALNETLPEVVLKNGHDGTSQYHLMMGLFRLICMNGMVVSDSMFGDIKVPHRGQALDKVIEGTFEVLQHADEVMARVDDMRQIALNPDEARIFAKAALQVRFGDELPDSLQAEPLKVLKARRREDQLPDLWTVYNRAQENLIKGGISFDAVREDAQGRQNHIRQTTRPVRSVDGDIKLNRALWTLADEMAKLKA